MPNLVHLPKSRQNGICLRFESELVDIIIFRLHVLVIGNTPFGFLCVPLDHLPPRFFSVPFLNVYAGLLTGAQYTWVSLCQISNLVAGSFYLFNDKKFDSL